MSPVNRSKTDPSETTDSLPAAATDRAARDREPEASPSLKPSTAAILLLMISSTALAQDAPPPIPERYQVIDLSPYTAIDMNDNGEVLLGDLFYNNEPDYPGPQLGSATYYVWRDANRDAEIDPVELTQVCSYQFAWTGSFQPEGSPFTYYSVSTSGCKPVAINNAGQVLAVDGYSIRDVVNCTSSQCSYTTEQRARGLIWQNGNTTFIDGLVEIRDGGASNTTTQDLNLYSLNNSGEFSGSGYLADPLFFGVTPFIYDGSQRFLPINDTQNPS